MAKVQKIAEITPNIPFSEFDFYDLYRSTFEKSELGQRLGIHRPRTKFIDVQKANLTYRKQRKHSKSQTRKMTRRLLELLGKILKEIREMVREHGTAGRASRTG